MQSQMLSCFFPTTVVFIDDNSNYLKGLLSAVDMQHMVPKLFSNPIEAVEFINQQQSLLQTALFTPIEDQPADHVGFDINIRDFHHKLLGSDKLRFNELTVVVCDYAMPQKNGLEVLQEIKNKELKTIMLTGEADELLAVAAFNRGLIDHFLRKGSSNFTQTLNHTLLALQQDYIARSTGLMVSNIILGKLPGTSALADPVVIKLINDIREKYHIIEYYLLDEQGSYLLLTQTGQAYFLALLNTAALDSFMQFAIDEGAPHTVIDPMAARTSLPFFYSQEDFNTPPSEWAPNLYPAQVLNGLETYYYTLIPAPDIYRPIVKPEQTYQHFLEYTHLA